MNEAPAQPQRVWTCQKCGRKMPARLDVCRCGAMRQPGTPDEASPATEIKPAYEPVENPPAPASQGVLQWIVLLTVAVIVAGALVAIQVVPTRKSTASMPDADSAAQIRQAPASTASELPPQELAPAPSNFADAWAAPGGSETASPSSAS